jgi:uncharacterized membrane protein YfcA
VIFLNDIGWLSVAAVPIFCRCIPRRKIARPLVTPSLRAVAAAESGRPRFGSCRSRFQGEENVGDKQFRERIAARQPRSQAMHARSNPVILLEPPSFLMVSAGIFAGALVSGLMGFAFSAVAGAILLHVMPPTEAVPLMMACSIITQAVTLVALRDSMKWRGSVGLIAGGVFGMLPALYLLQRVDPGIFRIGFGVFLIAYAAFMLLRPAASRAGAVPGRLRHAVVGFGGGLVGGLTAMPGALPAIWCDLRGMPRDQQRGLVQPYIVAMQLFALTLMLSRHSVSSKALLSLTFNLPALAAGAALGVVMFRRIDDAVFRRVVLAVLLFAGLLLVV